MAFRVVAAPAFALAMIGCFFAAATRADDVVSSGVFHNGPHAPQHTTAGSVSIVKTAKGYELRLGEDFRSTQGPDVRFILSPIPDAGDDRSISTSDYLIVAPRKALKGAQSYPLPASFRLGEIQIGCCLVRGVPRPVRHRAAEEEMIFDTLFEGAASR